MAIYKNKLVVKVERTTIDKDHLDDLMSSYFELENSNVDNNYEYNPRIFYNIIRRAEEREEDYKIIEGPVLMDGKECNSKLYIHLNNEALGQIVFMRSQMMTIYTKLRKCKRAEGVFICDSEEGNNFLRELENYKHSSWSKNNYLARNHTKGIVATRALKAIDTFIQESVAKELQLGAQETEQVDGLDKILTITTPKGVDDESKKDDIIDLENYKEEKPRTVKKQEKNDVKKIRQPRQTKAKFDPQGRLLSNSGNRRRKRPIKPGPLKPGTLKGKSSESEDGKTGIYAVPVEVSYRTWSQEEDGKVWHIVRIFSSKDIENAIIQLYAVDEDGRRTGLEIVEADGYEIRPGEEFVDSTDFNDSDDNSTSTKKQVKNAFSGVKIIANIPKTIKVRFNSALKYSLSIDTDQIEESNEK
jgi:hypothetical protein